MHSFMLSPKHTYIVCQQKRTNTKHKKKLNDMPTNKQMKERKVLLFLHLHCHCLSVELRKNEQKQ